MTLVRAELEGAPDARLWVITLARPDKRNALTSAMLDELIATASATPEFARAVLLRGEGESFCAGFDLSACRDDDKALRPLLEGLSTAIRTLRRLRQPVVAAAHGAAIAGGCALLGGADFVITHDGAKIGYGAVRLGLSPAVSGPSLANLVGGAATRELMLDPSLIDGREAARLGFAHESMGRAKDVEPAARALAQSLASKPAAGLAATKAWLNELDGSERDDAMNAALAASLSTDGTSELREMLAKAWARERNPPDR